MGLAVLLVAGVANVRSWWRRLVRGDASFFYFQLASLLRLPQMVYMLPTTIPQMYIHTQELAGVVPSKAWWIW
jgi:hypothetical protein